MILFNFPLVNEFSPAIPLGALSNEGHARLVIYHTFGSLGFDSNQIQVDDALRKVVGKLVKQLGSLASATKL